LMFRNEAELDRMIKTSKKKSPGAVQTTAFSTLRSLSDNHSAVVVADASPLLGMAEVQLQQLARFDPEGAAALREVRTISVTMDWESQPTVAATLHLSNEESRSNLADLVNMALGMAS